MESPHIIRGVVAGALPLILTLVCWPGRAVADDAAFRFSPVDQGWEEM